MSNKNKRNEAFVSWIGGSDLDVITKGFEQNNSLGPIASTLTAFDFGTVELLYNYPSNSVAQYIEFLAKHTSANIRAHQIELSSPVNFGEIYVSANELLSEISKQNSRLSILLSPGTPAMQAVWILLGKTRYQCTFLQSSIEQGVQEVTIPFELSAEYVPAAKSIDSEQLKLLSQSKAPVDAAFDNIVTRSPRMLALKAQAQILAEREVPVLITGETGTGKELFARAIHNASARKGKPFVPVNCGAIPHELVDSVLFGHKKGAFTGATSDKPGVFDQAHGGTLFLDEFGELEPSVQVRLLRVLQEGTFVPVGGTSEHSVDVRIITATHRNLMELVANGGFREDLFYRIAVGVLHLLPLREREGDLSLLIDSLLDAMRKNDLQLEHKNISPEARNLMFQHPWRGNIRELQSTLLRSALWCQGNIINADDIRQSLFSMPAKEKGTLIRDISQGIDINEIIGVLVGEYIHEALALTGQNKTRAAKLLGLKNYQTLNNWMEKYGIS